MPGGNVMLTFYRTDESRREVEVKIVCAKCDLEIMLRAIDGGLQGVPVQEPEVLTLM